MTRVQDTAVADPRSTKVFHFGRCGFDRTSGEATLAYRFDDGPELVETITFPYTPWPSEPSRQLAFFRALDLLHLVAGVSYWKACMAEEIRCESGPLKPEIADFIQDVYIQGLAEFGYVNQLNVSKRLHLPRQSPSESADEDETGPLLLPDRALVAMGGGKDSLVGLDLMQRAGIEVLPVCVGGSGLIEETVKAARLPLLRIGRRLAPELRLMNEAGAWNGHVPVTAINSAIVLCAAILYGYKYVVFSNERSADEATLTDSDGQPVNHQYSKSSSFERSLRELVHQQISADIEYFSILRPFSELDIVRRFTQLKTFHQVYSSCNRNFHLAGSTISGRWCVDCPKCRFAALSLAVFMSPSEVCSIMGSDLLADPDQEQGFRELCALGADKPFECVGESGESRAAMAALTSRARWKHHCIVKLLGDELRAVDTPTMAALLKPADAGFIPDEIKIALASESKA